MQPPSLVAVMTVLLLGAGCASATTPAAAPPATPAEVDAAEGTSAISGLVVDTESRPVAAAQVHVINRANPGGEGVTLATGDAGRFVATGLVAGNYLVFVARLGFREAPPRTVAVGVDETTEVTIVLEPTVIHQPFQESLRYGLLFHEQICVIAAGSPSCVTGYQTSNLSLTYDASLDKKGELMTLIVEARWSPTVGLCLGAVRTDVYSPEAEGKPGPDYRESPAKNPPFHWDNVPEAARSPTRVFIPRFGEGLIPMLGAERTEANGGTPIDPSGPWAIRSFAYPMGTFGTAVDVSCLVNQPVELWVSAFFGDPTPKDDWSALKDL